MTCTEIWQAATGIQANNSTILMNNVTVLYGGTGIVFESDTRHGHLSLLNSRIEENARNGLDVLDNVGNSVHRIQNSTFVNNGKIGIVFVGNFSSHLSGCIIAGQTVGIHSSTENLKIIGCQFLSNNYAVVFNSLSQRSIFSMNQSRVIQNQYGIRLDYGAPSSHISWRRNNITIDNTEFILNAANAIDVSSDSFAGFILIENSTFKGKGKAVAIHRGFNVTVNKCTFQNLRNAIFVNSKNSVTKTFITINGSRFISCSGDFVNMLKVNQLEIYNNTYVGNNALYCIDASTDEQTDIHFNTFQNPKGLYDLRVSTNLVDLTTQFNATLNYWSADSLEDLHSRVCGFYCNMAAAPVRLLPFYVTPWVLSNLTSRQRFKIDAMNNIGGELYEDVLLARKVAYTVVRTIHVPRGRQLVIPRGVKMRFYPDTGIYVEGMLNCTN